MADTVVSQEEGGFEVLDSDAIVREFERISSTVFSYEGPEIRNEIMRDILHVQLVKEINDLFQSDVETMKKKFFAVGDSDILVFDEYHWKNGERNIFEPEETDADAHNVKFVRANVFKSALIASYDVWIKELSELINSEELDCPDELYDYVVRYDEDKKNVELSEEFQAEEFKNYGRYCGCFTVLEYTSYKEIYPVDRPEIPDIADNGFGEPFYSPWPINFEDDGTYKYDVEVNKFTSEYQQNAFFNYIEKQFKEANPETPLSPREILKVVGIIRRVEQIISSPELDLSVNQQVQFLINLGAPSKVFYDVSEEASSGETNLEEASLDETKEEVVRSPKDVLGLENIALEYVAGIDHPLISKGSFLPSSNEGLANWGLVVFPTLRNLEVSEVYSSLLKVERYLEIIKIAKNEGIATKTVEEQISDLVELGVPKEIFYTYFGAEVLNTDGNPQPLCSPTKLLESKEILDDLSVVDETEIRQEVFGDNNLDLDTVAEFLSVENDRWTLGFVKSQSSNSGIKFTASAITDKARLFLTYSDVGIFDAESERKLESLKREWVIEESQQSERSWTECFDSKVIFQCLSKATF